LAAVGVFPAIMGIGPVAIKRIYRYNVQEDCFAMNYTPSSSLGEQPGGPACLHIYRTGTISERVGRAHYINPKEDKTLDSIKRDTSSNRWTITNTYATSLSRELRSDVSKEYRHPRQRLGIGRLLHSQGVKNSISEQYFK
ncbi:hypothetical protein Tco_1397097, partial [Tanacetum coccineum]